MSDSIISPMQVQMPTASAPKLRTDSLAKLEKAAGEFEGIFMDIVMKSMRETVGESSAFGDPEKVKFFQSMLDTEYSKELGEKGHIGLKEVLVKQLAPKLPQTNNSQGMQG